VRRRYFGWRLEQVTVDTGIPVRRLGTPYGGWTVPVQLVNRDSVVYCLGAGNDVSFETELISETGCEVFSFDPTDASAAHVAQLHEPKLHFLQVAVWNRDGTLRMYKSPVPTSTTLSAANLDVGHVTTEVPCRSLPSLMRELGHDRIDLLKYHLEGSEYEVFDPALLSQLNVKILGIRLFHTAPPRTAMRLIAAIREKGYALVAHKGSAFTFVRRDASKPSSVDRLAHSRVRARPRRQRDVRSAGVG
jgi:FkbM family methyltransferase